jgi:hypothetical protein
MIVSILAPDRSGYTVFRRNIDTIIETATRKP